MTSRKFKQLLVDYEQNKLNAAESKLVEKWLDVLEHSGNAVDWEESELDALFKNIPLAPKTKRLNWKPWMYAAALIMVFFVFLAIYKREQAVDSLTEITANKILPVEDVAVLTLENGEKIYLDERKEGIGMTGGQLRYSDGTPVRDDLAELKKLTLSTPKGKKYSVTLPDGSKVWLNAASTLTYPFAFDSKRRIVELEGEAYFEVAKSTYQVRGMKEATPFVVQTKNQQINVLGTHFNISAYREANCTFTSLVEGAVQVVDSYGGSQLLKPGQQSIVSHDQQSIRLVSMDIDAVLGWKNDLFVFHNSSLKEILEEVERWYEITVDIKTWPQDRFYGEVQRGVPLSEVLNMVEMSSNLRFKVIADGQERRLLML